MTTPLAAGARRSRTSSLMAPAAGTIRARMRMAGRAPAGPEAENLRRPGLAVRPNLNLSAARHGASCDQRRIAHAKPLERRALIGAGDNKEDLLDLREPVGRDAHGRAAIRPLHGDREPAA